MVRKSIYALLLLLLVLTGCQNTSGPRFEGEVHTLAGLLVAGKPIGLEYPVYVTRSSAIDDFNPLEIFVWNAEITVWDLDSGLEFELTPALHDFKFKYIDTAENIIQPEHRYRIEVRIPGFDKLISAETTVPPCINAEPDPYNANPPGVGWSLDPNTENQVRFSRIDSDFPAIANTGSHSGNMYLLSEIYCLEDFSTDLEYTSQMLENQNPPPEMEEVYNAGRPPRRINIMYRFNSAPLPGLPDNYIVLNNYSAAFFFYGRYRVRMRIVDVNYFNYNFMEEGYLHGGVSNALGYFGSASSSDMFGRVVK